MVEPARAASKISLVLADVDGTLVTADKVLTSRAGAAVKALHTAGIAFAITSGRPPRGMAGSAIFGSGDYAAAIARIRSSTSQTRAVAQ